MLTHVRELTKTAGPDGKARFGFDGEILRVYAVGELIVVPAEGQAWPVTALMQLVIVDQLPKRLMHEVTEVGVWNGCLYYGHCGVMLGQGDVEPVANGGAAL